MKVLSLIVWSLLAPASFAGAGDSSSLAGFPGITDVAIGSAHPRIPEARLRRLIGERLQRSSLLLEDGAAGGARLAVRVSGDHNTSASGLSYSFYDVTVTVSESASLDRDPSVRLSAVVWQRAMRVGTFAKEVPEDAVIDKVNDLVSLLLAAVVAERPVQ